MKKLKFGIYPYTYARSAVMRSLLFKMEDYQKMLKMGFSEIAKLLQESHYRKDINELATNYSGSDLIELALNRNLAGSFKKLMRISSPELGLLIREYAKRRDIEDIKTIIRGKFTKADEKDILRSITGAGTLEYEFLVSLMKSDSIEDVLKRNKIVDFAFFKDALKDLNDKNSVAHIENTLDRQYYAQLMRFSSMLPKQGRLFRDFLFKEIEILNLLTILRLKKAKFPKDEIKNFIIPSRENPKGSRIISLLNLEDHDQISSALENTEYKKIAAKGMDEFRKSNSLIALETGLYSHLLGRSLLFMHQHPLSIDVIIGYMLAKEIEVRNLKILIKGKQLGLDEQFIESQLVY